MAPTGSSGGGGAQRRSRSSPAPVAVQWWPPPPWVPRRLHRPRSLIVEASPSRTMASCSPAFLVVCPPLSRRLYGIQRLTTPWACHDTPTFVAAADHRTGRPRRLRLRRTIHHPSTPNGEVGYHEGFALLESGAGHRSVRQRRRQRSATPPAALRQDLTLGGPRLRDQPVLHPRPAPTTHLTDGFVLEPAWSPTPWTAATRHRPAVLDERRDRRQGLVVLDDRTCWSPTTSSRS
jgi:hypothetical protein